MIPNLLVKNISKEIEKSKAIKIYASNVMTQPGETDGYNVLDHVEAINKSTNRNLIDYVICNKENIPDATLKKYNKDGAKQLIVTEEEEQILKDKNVKVIKDCLIDIKKDYIRHDADRLSEIIVGLTIEKLEKEKMSRAEV